jgi:anti-sigma regulatory factor (Ser/Thr protein kinase)
MKEILLTEINATEIPDAAAWIERQCYHYGLADEDSYQVRTCVVEAINNSFEHAYSGGAGSINVAIWRDKDHLNVEVLDFGSAPKRNFYRQDEPAMPDAERGRGWLIIEAWMNKASFMRIGEKNIVRLAKRIPI